jgi:two-component system, cell cycle sensor histidine kinase and response regulator CckA
VTDAAAPPVVLLVEDEEIVRTLAARVLEDEGYTVITAETAADALCLVNEQRPRVDVILTDVVMPGATGPELVRQILPLLQAPAVIYMSGYTGNALRELEPGAEFLSKPFSLAALSETLGRVISTQRLSRND